MSARFRMDLDDALARVEEGQSPNTIRGQDGHPPLMIAMFVGDMPAFKKLLDAGADPYQDFRALGLYMSTIETAIGGDSDNCLEALEILLKHPGVLGEKAPFADSLMETAAKIGTPKTITALVEAGVCLDGPKIAGRLPLESAVSSTKDNVLRVRTMLALGAKPVEVHQEPADFKPTQMIKQLVDAMAHGQLYNAARTLDKELVMHVMNKLGTQADPDDERAARRWAKSSKSKGAKEIADLFDGFLQAVKAKEVVGNVAKLASARSAPVSAP